MSRYIMTFGLLAAVVIWLVLSYTQTALPQLAVSNPALLAWFPALALGLLGIFALLQLDLVRATARMLRRPAGDGERAAVQMFGLRTGREVLWTALPLAGTAALAAWLLLA